MNFTVSTEFSQNKNRVLKDFILNLLKYIIDEKSLSLYVQPKCMEIWYRAFTPESIDPTNNYEEDEYLGDRALKATTPIYLLNRNPNYTTANITYIDTLTMEKTTQAKLAVELGLTHYINTYEPSNISIYGDIYESFFGALYKVGNIVSPKMGIILVYNMHTFIFNQNIIPTEIEQGNDKMIVEQIFIQLGLTQPKVTIFQENQLYKVEIILTLEQLEFFEKNNIIIKTPVLVSILGKSKIATIMNAYRKVKLVLSSYGVNNKFITDIKTIRNQDKIVYEIIQKNRLVFDIKALILDLIGNIIFDDELNKYVNDKAMDIWTDVFNNNNEKYQFIGEIILKGLIPAYLVTIYEDNVNYNKEKYNNILANITHQYGMFLTKDIYIPLHDKYNFESFFGGLFTISNQLLQGIGFVNCELMIAYIFGNKIPEEFGYKHPKMYFDQLFISFVKNPKLLVDEQHDEIYTYKLYLTDEQLQFLKSEGIKIKDKLIGSAEGPTKKSTEREAYQNARTLLNTLGINEYWSRRKKEEKSFDHPELQVYKKILDAKNKQLGYDYIYFKLPIKTTTQNNITMQLIGVTINGKKNILSHIVYNKDTKNIDSKIQLIKNYLNIK